VPDRVSVVDPEESAAIVAVALKLPGAFGENTTVSVALWPAATVVGKLGALNEKNLVEKEELVIVTAPFPVLVALMVMLLLVPELTVPKSRLEADHVRLPPPIGGCEPGLPVLMPWQPNKIIKEIKTGIAVQRVAVVLMGFESYFF